MPQPRKIPQVGDVVDGHKLIAPDYTKDESWQPLSGEEFLKTIPTGRANLVRMILDTRAPFPTSLRGTKPDAFSNQIMQDVAMTEPGFDAAQWKARQGVINDFKYGPTSKIIRAVNQAAGHAKSMSDAYDALNNGRSEWGNWIANGIQSDIPFMPGQKRIQGAIGAADEIKEVLAPELATVFRGGGAAEADVESQRKGLTDTKPPAYSHAHLGEVVDAMSSRADSLQEQWLRGMGPTAKPFPILDPKAKEALDFLKGRYSPQAAAAEGLKLGADASDVPQPKKVGRFTVEEVKQP